MIQCSIISTSLALLIPLNLLNHPILELLIGGIAAFLLAYVLTFGVKKFCYKVGWLDYPAERRVHTKAVPRLGGVAMFLAFVIASLLFYTPGNPIPVPGLPNTPNQANELVVYWLLVGAAALMVLVHAYDDVLGLKPLPKLLAQTVAVIVVMGPWDGVFHGILLFTFNNPFGLPHAAASLPWYLQPTLFLFVHTSSPTTLPPISWQAIPAVLLTWFWTAGMMNSVNWIDGMDGLATGAVGIAGIFITIFSFMLGQQSIAVLAAIFTGSVLGFLPHNWNPAKIFMGDTGSMFLGLGLAVLSIMGGAKLALALMVLGVPILDVAVVIINRIRRGQSPMHYDKTHLHHRLMATGLSVKQICYVIYSLSLIFGISALMLSGTHKNTHLLKFIGVIVVAVTMVGFILWLDYRQRTRGKKQKADASSEQSNANLAFSEQVQEGQKNEAPSVLQEDASLMIPSTDLSTPIGKVPLTEPTVQPVGLPEEHSPSTGPYPRQTFA